mmetsp:Transcript_14840/g.40611  ORF Transcript_14840/g.40611 Transcript_14840/m.40611 type:complete len:312 (-) Transcript_14840:162-1097(-)
MNVAIARIIPNSLSREFDGECVRSLTEMLQGVLATVPPAAHRAANDAHPEVLACAASVARRLTLRNLSVPADRAGAVPPFGKAATVERVVAQSCCDSSHRDVQSLQTNRAGWQFRLTLPWWGCAACSSLVRLLCRRSRRRGRSGVRGGAHHADGLGFRVGGEARVEPRVGVRVGEVDLVDQQGDAALGVHGAVRLAVVFLVELHRAPMGLHVQEDHIAVWRINMHYSHVPDSIHVMPQEQEKVRDRHIHWNSKNAYLFRLSLGNLLVVMLEHANMSFILLDCRIASEKWDGIAGERLFLWLLVQKGVETQS